MSTPRRPGRRIVAFTDHDGRSKFWAGTDEPAAVDFKTVPGLRSSVLWATGQAQLQSGSCPDPVLGLGSLHPQPGGSLFMTVTVPPDSVYSQPDFDPEAAAAEQARHLPGIAERMEPDAPGFHSTDTIDYAIVLAGEIYLEVDAEEKRLRSGDCVVQLGGRHAWRNRGNKVARLAFILLGATRSAEDDSQIGVVPFFGRTVE